MIENNLAIYCNKLGEALSNGLADHIERTHESIEVVSSLSSEDFVTKYFIPQKPVLIKEGCKNWKACSQFNIDYLKAKTHNIEVELNGYFDNNKNSLFHDFLDEIKHGTINAIQELHLCRIDAGLSKDIANNYFYIPENKLADFFYHPFQSLWINTTKSVTILHEDFCSTSTLNAQLQGTKKWILIYPQATLSKDQGDSCNYPQFLTDNYMFIRHVLVEEGDIIFVPARHFHQVTGLSNLNVSLTTQLLHPDHVSYFVQNLTTTLCTALAYPEKFNPRYLISLKNLAKTILQISSNN